MAQQSGLSAACVSDTGKVRKHNEDNYLIDEKHALFIVSDGMGGHQAGELASRIVVTVLPPLLWQSLSQLLHPTSQQLEQLLRDAIMELSQRLLLASADIADVKGLGATLVLLWIRDSTAWLAHMGDSRIYLLRQRRLTQLTRDHSVINMLLEQGEITPDEVRTHPARGRISRFIGMESEAAPDVQALPLQAGDCLLLCSDGLVATITDAEIEQLLLQKKPDPHAACQALVDAANAAGGPDNITTLLVIAQ